MWDLVLQRNAVMRGLNRKLWNTFGDQISDLKSLYLGSLLFNTATDHLMIGTPVKRVIP